ncbi:MAG TPA: thermosome subunit, partial [Thermoplasmatales archaeon]|nr:thermosome subunit [Thermoplasmatales archaeon]
IDIMIKVRAAHKKGMKYAGVDVENGDVADMFKNNVIEPLRVSTQEVKAAAEAATMILRIDDVIAAKGTEAGKGAGAGTPPGAGGEGFEY